MNPAFIQTVHGFTHPIIASKLLKRAQEDQNEAAETTTQLYRDETARRLEENNRKAKRVPVGPKSS
ncbi:hypothetical protein [Rhodopirellula halodulae]|nr:hypothetical protein [Rhodopirellula sp. JC737]